ncbi:MAG: DUF177 domain-containing protein [Clostridiales bacterium]
MLIINVAKIKSIPQYSEKVSIEGHILPENYGYPDLWLDGPVAFCGDMTNQKDYLLIRGKITAVLHLICDRCGEPFSFPIAADFEEAYSHMADQPDKDGQRDIHLFDREEIDISAEILKQIFLEMPMKNLCQEDCQGICPVCGVNLNLEQCCCQKQEIDPRLEKLKEFIFEGEKKGV